MLDFSCREYFYGDVERGSAGHSVGDRCVRKPRLERRCSARRDLTTRAAVRTALRRLTYFVPHVDDAVIVIAAGAYQPQVWPESKDQNKKSQGNLGRRKFQKGKNIELSLRDALKYSGLDSLGRETNRGTATGPDVPAERRRDRNSDQLR